MFLVETDQKTHQWKNTIKLIVMTQKSDLKKLFDKHTYTLIQLVVIQCCC